MTAETRRAHENALPLFIIISLSFFSLFLTAPFPSYPFLVTAVLRLICMVSYNTLTTLFIAETFFRSKLLDNVLVSATVGFFVFFCLPFSHSPSLSLPSTDRSPLAPSVLHSLFGLRVSLTSAILISFFAISLSVCLSLSCCLLPQRRTSTPASLSSLPVLSPHPLTPCSLSTSSPASVRGRGKKTPASAGGVSSDRPGSRWRRRAPPAKELAVVPPRVRCL